ncbi:MAG: alpha/beta hydrolase [Candidatus Eremiobacteraeota bacterium]|nr:alpha/beta hydrolase [Candidatus Eremiobacteraeota bacterium]
MRVTNGEAQIDVRVDGENGDAVVLLAGLMLSHEIWDAQVKTLAATHRVIRADMRGTGSSNAPGGPYLMESLAGDIAAVLDSLGIERAAIVGHSLGGYVALAFARMHLERLTRLALVCSHLEADTMEMSKFRNDLAANAESQHSVASVVHAFYPRMLAAQRYVPQSETAQRLRMMMQAADVGGTVAMLRGMALRDPATDIAPDLAMPVLVVAGACDQTISLDEARRTADKFPHANLEIVDSSGHVPMIEEPDCLTNALDRWLMPRSPLR